MSSYRTTSPQDLGSAEARRSSRSFLVFLAWIGAELAAYAALILVASDTAPRNCGGLCFSPRGTLILLGMMFGLFVLVGQLIIGLLLTTAFTRRRMTSLAAGSAAFFTTLVLSALVITGLAITQR
ncbi:hypothetical protein [Kribbella sp. NPDC023855]|uniref:hypothetical protein n=1 Tax=Kribbella sp. NPDC023855 TaxID=3154698 RepID=UPI0033DBDBCF